MIYCKVANVEGVTPQRRLLKTIFLQRDVHSLIRSQNGQKAGKCFCCRRHDLTETSAKWQLTDQPLNDKKIGVFIYTADPDNWAKHLPMQIPKLQHQRDFQD